MSLFLGSIYSTMELDTGKLGPQVAGAKRTLTGLSDSAEGVGKSSQMGFGQMVKASALGNLAAIGLSRGIEAVTSAAGDSFRALTSIQTARASFEVLTGSAEKASTAMRDIANYANSTPFEFQTVAQAGKTLLGFGVTTDDLGRRIRQLGDVTGATGGDFQGIARVFGQVQAQGKLTAEDFNQLVDNGVALGDVIAKQLGIPVSELRDQMEKGAITTEVFNKALDQATASGGRFFGGADKLSQTLTGRISTLKDTFTGMVGSFVGVDFSTGVVKAGGAFDTLSNSIAAATKWMSENKEQIALVAGVIGGALLTGITLVAQGLGATIGFIASWVEAFRSGNPVVQGLTVFLGAFVIGLAAVKIGLFLYGAAMTIATVATTAFAAVLAFITSPVTLVVAAIAALIAIGFLVVKNWDTIKAAATTVLGAAWEGIKTGLTAVKTFFINTWNSIAAFFQQYGVILLAVIAPIIGIPILIYQHWGQITAFFANVWATLSAAFMTGVQAVIGFFQQLPYNIGFAVGTMVRILVDFATVTIPNFVNGVISWIAQLPGRVAEFFTNMANSAVSIATGMVENVSSWVAQLPGRIGGFISDAWNRVTTGFQNIYNTATSIVSNTVNSVASFFSALPGRVLGAISSVVSTVTGIINDVKNAMTNGASSAVDNTVNFFRELPSKIMGAISGLAGSIGDKFKSIASSAWSGFKAGLGINSPSYIEESFMAIGRQGASTVKDMNRDMKDLNNLATAAQRIDMPVGGMNGGDFGSAAAAGGSGNVYNITLPNVQNANDFAREFKLATVGRG